MFFSFLAILERGNSNQLSFQILSNRLQKLEIINQNHFLKDIFRIQLINNLYFLNIFYFIKEHKRNMNINTKSNFLQKKRQQRKKTQDQIETKGKMLVLQKNIRAFLCRQRLIQQASKQNNVHLVLMIGGDLSVFTQQIVNDYVVRLLNQAQPKRSNSLKKLIMSLMKSQQTSQIQLALKLISQKYQSIKILFSTKKFISLFAILFKKNQGYPFLNFVWNQIRNSGFVNLLPLDLLFDNVIHQYLTQKIEQQSVFSQKINNQIILSILDYLSEKKYQKFGLGLSQFRALSLIMTQCLKQSNQEKLSNKINAIIYIVQLLKTTLKNQFDSLVGQLMQKQKFKSIFNLIQDEEQLVYLQHKIKSQPQFQQFCQLTLQSLHKIFHQFKPLHLLMIRSSVFRENLTILIREILFIYDDRHVLFVYSFLSDEKSLKQMSKEKKFQFYSALRMKLLTMDDQDFVHFKLFDQKQWRQIIQTSIAKAFEITKKMLGTGLKKQGSINIKNKLFKKDEEIQEQFKILSQLLNNLNKKCLRTNKIPNQYFINQDLDKFLNAFKFGVGARAIQLMLKNFPFTFRFQSRVKKLRQFIKSDKLNHDRSLFLQQEVDPDLIIAVRRGHQFLDAYDACYQKDLRKKYKIIFFNEQGLQQEGIDGGGIIKQFINRILKSSFSITYGMFYETSQNQILPNHACVMTNQYQFVGKIVGKAVYQSINIDQKFAQPFLNLLIGRQNSFQDLQYIDKQIYKSMVDIRRMSDKDIQLLQQTFTIMDVNPYGQQKYINLKNISGKSAEVLLTNENKIQFVQAYADFKCNKQLEQKTRLFRKGFLTVMKSQWLTMFSNQELNHIISGSNPDYSIIQLRNSVVFNDYNQKSQTIIDLWSVLSEFTPQQKSSFLFFVTSCSRPPTMGFAAMKPLICIQKSTQLTFLPTANTCMNVLRLPDYKNKQTLKQKLLYAINAKAGFQFA